MEPNVPLGAVPDSPEINELLSLFDAPAYIRRARGVEEATAQLLAKCRHQRDEWLDMVKLHLGTLHALAGDWAAVRPLLADDLQPTVLAEMHGALQPRLKAPPEKTTSRRALRRTLKELIYTVERFNRRWQGYLEKIDLSDINAVREGYNRYYVIEKSCAMRSDLLARQGFEPLAMMTLADVTAQLPLLPVLRMA